MATRQNIGGPMVSTDQLAAALQEGMPATERWLELAGVTTSMIEGGQGPPIVLLHGQGGFKEMWLGFLPHLVGSHRIVAPDLPGLGRSEVRTATLDASGMVAWLGELIDQTCAEPPTLVGTSLGGTFAAHFAIEHGDRVRQIVLVDSGSLGRFRPALGVLPALIRYVKHPTPDTYDRFQRQVFFDPERVRAQRGDRAAAFRAYHIDRTSQPSVRAANRELLRRIGMWRIPADQLAKISVPVALIWGRNDRVMRFRIAEKASARFGWPLYAIENAGHAALIERPDVFLNALRSAISVDA
jgi:pimeloyl-ACP methyl ester carboxylesterase